MSKIFRLLAIGVFAIAVTATVTAPKAVASEPTVLANGGAPVPLCAPGQPDCKPW